ncbi:hypothetical protein ABIB90_000407 [Bradyrhizobium sp. JR4.1]
MGLKQKFFVHSQSGQDARMEISNVLADVLSECPRPAYPA